MTTEQKAMCLDRQAILAVVSALREYREVCAQLLAGRYRDGTVDGSMTTTFASRVEAIEEKLSE